jgi:hypothetical protein
MMANGGSRPAASRITGFATVRLNRANALGKGARSRGCVDTVVFMAG